MMSITTLRRSASLLPFSLAVGILAVGTASACASNSSAQNEPSLLPGAETSVSATASTTQQSSASAWSESSGGDHGMTVTTTRSGDSTSCMVVEWKRENGGIKKWQYRCDTPPQP